MMLIFRFYSLRLVLLQLLKKNEFMEDFFACELYCSLVPLKKKNPADFE